jgi:CBS domain-containing protein
MELSQFARRAVSIGPQATVLQACETMVAEGIGALVVLDDDKLVGIISERDVVVRVVAKRSDPEKTLVSEIMTTDVRTVTENTTDAQAMEMMHRGRFRHLPLIDASGKVTGMLSMRRVLRARVGELALKNADLLGYISADGPGG